MKYSSLTIQNKKLKTKFMATGAWQACIECLSRRINKNTFSTWIKPVNIISETENLLVLSAPSIWFVEYWEKHFRQTVELTLEECTDKKYKINMVVVKSERRGKGNKPQKQEIKYRKNNLNKRFIFDRFVEGPENGFAKTAAYAFATKQKNVGFNPLVIYGGTGLGKTHLAQAIGNEATRQNPEKKIKYATSERFFRDFINSISQKTTEIFSKSYRNVDMLLIDDVQFFQRKEQTQEQFFHTFNEILQNGKQIVLTLDRAPKDLFGMEERLISRFQSGLIVDVQPPGFETRIAILQQCAEREKLDLPNDVIEFIATHVQNNVRDLEGAIVRLYVRSTLSRAEINLEFTKREIAQIVPEIKSIKFTIDMIQEKTAEKLGFQKNQIIGKGRKKELALARQIAMYLSREMTEHSLKTIGMYFGGRDHTTVMHACRQIDKKKSKIKYINSTINTIKNQLLIIS